LELPFAVIDYAEVANFLCVRLDVERSNFSMRRFANCLDLLAIYEHDLAKQRPLEFNQACRIFGSPPATAINNIFLQSLCSASVSPTTVQPRRLADRPTAWTQAATDSWAAAILTHWLRVSLDRSHALWDIDHVHANDEVILSLRCLHAQDKIASAL
jgi:hypothetical protein